MSVITGLIQFEGVIPPVYYIQGRTQDFRRGGREEAGGAERRGGGAEIRQRS